MKKKCKILIILIAESKLKLIIYSNNMIAVYLRKIRMKLFESFKNQKVV